MNKALHALVYVIFVLAVVALVFEINLYGKRNLLGDRNRAFEDYVVKIAATIETADAPKTTAPELNKDVSPVEAKTVDMPDTENLLDEYPAQFEQQNLETFAWEGKRMQLRAFYLIGPDGKPVPDENNYNRPTVTGPGTMDELLKTLLERAMRQQSNLNSTRAELAAIRAKLETNVNELNKLKQEDRADKVTIEELKQKIEQLEADKAALEDQVAKLKSQIEELNAEVTSLKDELARAKDETELVKEELEKEKKRSDQLKKMLMEVSRVNNSTAGSGTAVAANLTTGVKGKIIRADNQLMFAVVEFTDAAMKELLGPEGNGALPQLELGIKREGFNGPAGEYIGRLRLRVRVEGKNYVIADLLSDWQQNEVSIGDAVFTE